VGSPDFHLPPHWFKVPLHPVHADRQSVFQREILRVFRQDGAIVSAKREIVTHEHTQSDRACQPEPLVIRVPNSDRESASLEAGLQIENTEHFHSIRRHCELLADYTDLAMTQGLD
jgi:hypothetical protein